MAWYKLIEFDHDTDIKKTGKTTIYKYRNWDQDKHSTILKELQLWAAHPKSFEDNYDIRCQYVFNKEEVFDDSYFDNVYFSAIEDYPNCRNYKTPIFFDFCKYRWAKIKKDPIEHFSKKIIELREGKNYDEIGVLSLTFAEPDKYSMWQKYANDGAGFCVGFDRKKLGVCLNRLLFFQGKIQYSNEKPLFSFKDFTMTEFLIKTLEWANEEEFRFVKYAIPCDEQRAFKFTEDCIEEIVLGYSISPENQEEILQILRNKFKSRIPLYKMVKIPDSKSLEKIPIIY